MKTEASDLGRVEAKRVTSMSASDVSHERPTPAGKAEAERISQAAEMPVGLGWTLVAGGCRNGRSGRKCSAARSRML